MHQTLLVKWLCNIKQSSQCKKKKKKIHCALYPLNWHKYTHTHNKNEAQSLETIFHSSFELHDCYTLQNPRLRYSGNAGSHLLLRH